MKTSIILLLLLTFSFSHRACTQEKKSVEQLFVEKFVNHNKGRTPFIKNNTLYISGSQNDFTFQDHNIIFLSLEEIRSKVRKDGEFNLIRMDGIFIEEKTLITSFTFLTAKKDYEVDFISYHNDYDIYCIDIDNPINVYWCGVID